KDITKKLKQLIDETNPKKNYESISKGLNDKELIILDDEIIKRFIDKNKLEFNGKYIVNYPKLMKDIENFTPKSNSAKEKIQVLKSIYNLRSSFEHIIDGIFNTKAKEAGKGISTDFKARAMTMLVNSFTDHVAFIFLRFAEIGKRAGLRIQMRRAFANINTLQDFNKASKNFIESIKDKTLKEEAQEARKEFNVKVKDLIKGDNFFMDKVDPSKAKSDYTAKFNVEKWINNVSGILKDEWVVNLKAMAKKHPEMFKNEADVFKVIKEIKDNPTHFFKNYDDEVALIAKPLKDDKVGNIAIKKDSGKIIHINKTKGKDLERLNRRNKAMLTGTPTPATTKGSTTNVEGDLLQHSFKNSTQAKPKKNLMDDIKDNIKNKEVEKKNKKSVKQRLDEKIQNDKKASEDILKRYDNFLKENKDYNLDVMGNLDVVTREFILNAKKKTHKGKKADIPDLMRSKIEKELNIQPLKEFGKNYAEYYHDGKGALQKLLIEKQGQVAGAFHRKDLGDIDLVWGEVIDKIKHKGYGLAHIIDKHPELDLKLISDIVDKGKLNNQNNIRYRIEYKNYIIGLSSEYKGNKRTFIITAFERYKG
ncbi:TPA: hypothetical protein ACHD0I_001786, partial [Campylobacter jejuni]